MSLPPLDDPQKDSKRSPLGILRLFDKTFLIALGAGLAIMAVAVVLAIQPWSSDSDEPTPSPTPEASKVEKLTPASEPASPLLQEGLEFPEVAEAKDAVTIEVKNNTITASQAGSPTLVLEGDNKVTSAVTPCSLKDTLSYCLAAKTQFGSQTFDYFFTRDLVHSKTLRSATDVRPVEIEGAPSAVFATINLGAQGERRVLAIAAPDSSGYMIVLPEGANASTEDTVLSTLKLQ